MLLINKLKINKLKSVYHLGKYIYPSVGHKCKQINLNEIDYKFDNYQ